MSILNFAWIDEETAYDPDLHAVQDEAVRRVEIEEREGAVPVCRVVVERPATGLLAPGRFRHALVSETAGGTTRLLFRGRLIAAPTALDGGFATLELEAATGDLAAALAAAIAPLAVAPFRDPLFARPGLEHDPAAVLEARHAAPFVDRRTGAVTVSDSLGGRAVSATEVAVGTGERTFAVAAGLGWPVGSRLRVVRQDDFGVFMEGPVTAYDDTALTIAVDAAEGTGVHGGWLIAVAFGRADIDGDALDMRRTGKPLAAVDVTVTAEWVQQDKGVIDLGARLRREAGGPIRTLSPDFDRRWPRPGAGVGANSGYRVAESALDPVPPPPVDLLATGPGGALVHFSPPFRVLSVSRERLRIFRYRPRLTVTYDYAQKRREVVRFTLEGHAQAMAGAEGGRLALDLRLQDVGRDPTPLWEPGTAYAPGDFVSLDGGNHVAVVAGADAVFDPAKWAPAGDRSPIGDRRRASFFLTDRGESALHHAVEVAATRLAESQRAVEVSFTVHGWPPALAALGCDHVATVESPKLPGGRATGKVVAVTLVRDGDRGAQWGAVTIACSVGLGHTPATAESANAYVEGGYAADGWLAESGARATAGRGIGYASYADQQPTQGLVGLAAMGDDDWVAAAAFENLYDDQVAFLEAHQWYGPAWGADGTAGMAGGHYQLPLVPTDLALEMIDITGSDELVHEIAVTPTQGFGRFATIDLAAG